jgi:hypothetical protein
VNDLLLRSNLIRRSILFRWQLDVVQQAMDTLVDFTQGPAGNNPLDSGY